MKVLKPGVLIENMVVSGTCWRCKAEVEFKVCEGRVTENQRDGTFVGITCPTQGCRETISVTLISAVSRG